MDKLYVKRLGSIDLVDTCLGSGGGACGGWQVSNGFCISNLFIGAR